ncbi:hypothetical protein Pse7367_2160 [Thalassoporum mexicanum PCC 7367]|nr:hypothetical protein Pse7367_2160 [Pseudanabaena sp. PCC 7367]
MTIARIDDNWFDRGEIPAVILRGNHEPLFEHSGLEDQ